LNAVKSGPLSRHDQRIERGCALPFGVHHHQVDVNLGRRGYALHQPVDRLHHARTTASTWDRGARGDILSTSAPSSTISGAVRFTFPVMWSMSTLRVEADSVRSL
jgi:hypothetical protein